MAGQGSRRRWSVADGGGVLYGCIHVWADSPDSHTLCSRPCRDERVVRDQSPYLHTYAEKFAPGPRRVYSHTTDRHSRNNGTFKVRRQATGQVVVVVWWWCKIRETARLAANGALLDE